MEATANPQDGKKDGAGEEDLSMEEILQSIRRIIADEGDDPAKSKADEGDVPGSDVLELTEMVKDDGSVVSLKGEPTPVVVETPKPAAPAIKEELPADVLSRIDEALAAKPVHIEKPRVAPAVTGDSLLSAEAAAAAATSFNKLKAMEDTPAPLVTTPSPHFRNGNTVEDIVADMLKPMIKEWLDANLPQIVERLVEREVKRLTK